MGYRLQVGGLSAPAAEVLAELEAVGEIGPFSTSTVRRAFIRAPARIGIHGVHPADLRHSYGTALYRVAGDTRLFKDVLGQSDTRMTERYTLGPRTGGDALGDIPLRGAPRRCIAGSRGNGWHGRRR